MVSGFLISPKDHDRIRSGEAKLILISSKALTGATGLNGLVESSWFISYLMNWGGGQRGPKFFGEKFWPEEFSYENSSIPPPHPGVPCSGPNRGAPFINNFKYALRPAHFASLFYEDHR